MFVHVVHGEGTGSPGPGIRSSCEQHDVDAESHTRVFCKPSLQPYRTFLLLGCLSIIREVVIFQNEMSNDAVIVTSLSKSML